MGPDSNYSTAELNTSLEYRARHHVPPPPHTVYNPIPPPCPSWVPKLNWWWITMGPKFCENEFYPFVHMCHTFFCHYTPLLPPCEISCLKIRSCHSWGIFRGIHKPLSNQINVIRGASELYQWDFNVHLWRSSVMFNITFIFKSYPPLTLYTVWVSLLE